MAGDRATDVIGLLPSADRVGLWCLPLTAPLGTLGRDTGPRPLPSYLRLCSSRWCYAADSTWPARQYDDVSMHDPDEGVGPDGSIVTGARRESVPVAFEPVIVAAADGVRAVGGDITLYLYGSVATGRARIGESDVDLLTVGVPTAATAAITGELSRRFASICRGVEIGTAQPKDFVGETDEVYGNRVFLRHYCVQVSGTPRADLSLTFPADLRAARGFNGDIAAHAQRWRRALDAGADPATVANRLARKTLLAVASLVSIHDETWTTDRARSASRWAEIDPLAAPDMAVLVDWAEFRATGARTRRSVQHMIDGTVTGIVAAFTETIGLWSDHGAD